MIHPIPAGTRDVLPDEMRELRAIDERLRSSFADAGYGEVWTPMVEYEDVLNAADLASGSGGSGGVSPPAAFRMFDDQGKVLALRSDMTVPIARVVATRFPESERELRLCYSAHSYRAVGHRTGQQREFLQSGIELIGVPGPEGEAEVVTLALEALANAGLARHRIGVGDGALYRRLLEALEVPADDHRELLDCLTRRDMVGLELRVDALGLARDARDLLVGLPELRGGPEVLDRGDGPAGEALARLRELYATLEARGIADRVILDLGLVRDLGYYTGAVFELYDPAVGFALGGGGRYDDLIARFGAPRPACGIALDVQRVHVAQAAEEAQR
ncbi:MAG TPA: ATP phosphoribosyltransferase regulatory subunit [Solirubrobacteraceae bacterium]|nr:ATP phosphoribosyltransferase regulatory subunit [Solirubrobacteraceae bacterium]